MPVERSTAVLEAEEGDFLGVTDEVTSGCRCGRRRRFADGGALADMVCCRSFRVGSVDGETARDRVDLLRTAALGGNRDRSLRRSLTVCRCLLWC